jgi:hypothetical protein
MPVKPSDVYNVATGAGKTAHEVLKKFRGVIVLSTLALASAGSLAVAKSLSPEAVADNSGKFLLNETLKTSLAKSRQDNEAIRRAKKLQELRATANLPHDKFV